MRSYTCSSSSAASSPKVTRQRFSWPNRATTPPLVRIGDHVGRAVAMRLEVVFEVGGDEAVRPGVALERQREQLPRGAVRAIGTDHPVAAQRDRPCGCIHAELYARSV